MRNSSQHPSQSHFCSTDTLPESPTSRIGRTKSGLPAATTCFHMPLLPSIVCSRSTTDTTSSPAVAPGLLATGVNGAGTVAAEPPL